MLYCDTNKHTMEKIMRARERRERERVKGGAGIGGREVGVGETGERGGVKGKEERCGGGRAPSSKRTGGWCRTVFRCGVSDSVSCAQRSRGLGCGVTSLPPTTLAGPNSQPGREGGRRLCDKGGKRVRQGREIRFAARRESSE